MLQNAYFLEKIGADTAENEQQFAEILPIGRRVADRRGAAREARDGRVAEPLAVQAPEPGAQHCCLTCLNLHDSISCLNLHDFL